MTDKQQGKPQEQGEIKVHNWNADAIAHAETQMGWGWDRKDVESVANFYRHYINFITSPTSSIPTEEQNEEAVSVWKSVEKHTLPLETPILLLHQYGVEAIQFHNAAWRYWYSSQPVDVHVLQTAKAFMVATDRNISSSAPPISHKEDEAVRFAEWINRDYIKILDKWCMKYNDIHDRSKHKTSSELYVVFKKSKANNI